MVSGGIIFWISTIAADALLKYPTVDCHQIIDDYGENLKRFAMHEWQMNMKLKSEGKPTQYVGNL